MGPLPICVLLVQQSDPLKNRWAHNVLSLLIWWCVIHVSIGLGLGVLHLFGARAILVAQAAVGMIGVAGIINCGSGLRVLRQLGLTPRFSAWSHSDRLLVGFVTLIALWLLVKMISRPVGETDSLAYHMPVMAKWYQHGSFVMLEQWLDTYARYPYNWEVLCALFYAPFGEDLMISFPQLAAWLILSLSIYCVAVRFGAATPHAIGAAVLTMTVPVAVEQTYDARVDLALAAFFLSSFYFSMVALEQRRLVSLSLAVGSLGLLAGIKTSGIVYAGMAIFCACMWGWNHSHPDQEIVRSRWMARVLAVFALCAGPFIGAFWYVRNWLEFGNPLGIVAVKVAGIELFPGSWDVEQVRNTTLAQLFEFDRLDHWRILIGQISQKLYLPFVVLALIAAAGFLSYRAYSRAERLNLVKMLVVLTLTGLAYWTNPATADYYRVGKLTPDLGEGFRYGLSLIGMLGVVAALAARASSFKSDTGYVVLVVVVAMMSLVQSDMPYAAEFVLMVSAVYVFSAAVAPLSTLLRQWQRSTVLGGVLLTCVVSVVATYTLRRERDARRHLMYGQIYDFVETQAQVKDVIGYAFGARSYPLYGKRWDKIVEYTPTNSEPDDLEPWIGRLARRGVTVLAIGPVPGWKGNPLPDRTWFSAESGRFIRASGGDWYKETVAFRMTAPLSKLASGVGKR